MNNKRKYPMSFFVIGIVINLIRTFYVGGLIVLLWIIGLVSQGIYIKAAGVISLLWFVYAVVEQFHIRKTCISKSENEDFNQMMDKIFEKSSTGEDNQ